MLNLNSKYVFFPFVILIMVAFMVMPPVQSQKGGLEEPIEAPDLAADYNSKDFTNSIKPDAEAVKAVIEDKALVDVASKDVDYVFTRLVMNYGYGAESRFTINNPGKDMPITNLAVKFNAVCGKVNGYKLFVLVNQSLRYADADVNLSHADTNYTVQVPVPASSIKPGENTYIIQGDVEEADCNGTMRYLVDWIPVLKVDNLRYTQDKWAWWDSYLQMYSYYANKGLALNLTLIDKYLLVNSSAPTSGDIAFDKPTNQYLYAQGTGASANISVWNGTIKYLKTGGGTMKAQWLISGYSPLVVTEFDQILLAAPPDNTSIALRWTDGVPATSTATFIAFRTDGVMHFASDDGLFARYNATINTWNHIKIIVNTTAKTYSAWVNDTLMLSNYSYYAAFPVSGFDFYMNGNINWLADNILVYNASINPFYSEAGPDTTPSISNQLLRPIPANVSSPITCNVTVADVDNATVIAEWKWYNGTTEKFTGTTTIATGATQLVTTLNNPGNVSVGESWNCTVRAFDGTTYTTNLSTNITISNQLHTLTMKGIVYESDGTTPALGIPVRIYNDTSGALVAALTTNSTGHFNWSKTDWNGTSSIYYITAENVTNRSKGSSIRSFVNMSFI